MNLIVQKVIKLKAFERLKHFLDSLLQVFNQGFVVYFKYQLCDENIFLLDSLLFLFNKLDEDLRFIVFLLNFPISQVNYLA